jgi:hypothetical protein
MKKISLSCFLTVLICLSVAFNAKAQFKFLQGNYKTKAVFSQYSTFEFGAGSSHYLGELNPYKDATFSAFVRMPRWNATVGVTRAFSPKFSARAAFTWARIAGDDNQFENNPERVSYFLRNSHFRNDIKEVSLVGIYNLMSAEKNFKVRAKFMPYIFAGIALFDHNPVAKIPTGEGSEWTSLISLKTEGQGLAGYNVAGYKPLQVAIPFGGGVKMKLNARWDVSIEASIRYTFTDYLDDISTTLADPNDLETQVSPLARQMGNRSLEKIAAYSGNDRTERVRQILVDYFNVKPGDPQYIDPFSVPFAGFSERGDLRGAPARLDLYMLTCIKLHYVILPKIKCPKSE